MGSIGEILRSTREAKGITLEQAEEDTKIRKRYLQALEDGDYDIIPGRVYAKGFLRNYATYLGLNQEEIMMEYKLLGMPVKDDYARTDIQASINRLRSNRRSSKKAYLLTVLVAILAVVTLVFYNFIYKNAAKPTGKTANPPVNEQAGVPANKQKNEPVDNSVYSVPNQDATAPEQGAPLRSGVSGGGQVPQDTGGINITLKGKDQVCWTRVTVDGVVRFTGNINPGETRTFSGTNKIVIKLGNAGGVEVIENGRNLGSLGSMGDVVTREFTSGTSDNSAVQDG